MKYSKYNLLINDTVDDNYILFNTLTGNSFAISSAVRDSISAGNINALTHETKEKFVKYGVIIEDNTDEARFFSYFHNKSKFDTSCVSSTVLLTWACNFACIYCFEGAGMSTETMDRQNAEKYIKFMIKNAEVQSAKSMYVNLFGGEPLVNIGQGFYILNELKKYCDDKGIQFSCGVITNGSLLNEQMINELIQYNCNMVQITLDGTKEIHNARRPYKGGKGSFDDIIASLKLLAQKSDQIKTVIRINIDKTNLSETDALLEYLGKSGEKIHSCMVDFGIVRSSTAACSSYSGNCLVEAEIGDVLEHLWCEAAKQGFLIYAKPSRRWMYCGLYSDSQYTITPDCGVYKCWEHAGMEEHRMGRIDGNGNLVDTTYALFDWMSKNPLEDSECRECVYLPVCGGGCGVVSYNETGGYHAKGCFKVKGVFEKQVRRFAIDAIKNGR